MTVKCEEPGWWFAYCDSCGERLQLDTAEDEPESEAIDELRENHGWRIEKPEKFTYGEATKYTETYPQHFCPYC